MEARESKNRNVWILVIVVLVVACCALAVLVAGAGWFAARSINIDRVAVSGIDQEDAQQTFQVGDPPTLDVENFAGSITVRAGQSGLVEVSAVKKAHNRARLNQIEVDISQTGSGLKIVTRARPPYSNMSVELEIRAPANANLAIETGAGTVFVDGITGPIDIESGAGQVDVHGAESPVRVQVGAGQILYVGDPAGDCRFETGAGEIRLSVPANWNMTVDLSTGIGAVGIDFPVDGVVSLREVRGVVGNGSQASIVAHTGVGAVNLNRR